MRKLITFFMTFLFVSNLFAAYNSFGIPDSAEIRKNLMERWYEAPLSVVRQNPPEKYKNFIGEEFQVRLEESDSTFNIFVSPSQEIDVNVYTDKGVHTEKQIVYPGDAPGSVVVIRDKKTEKILRIRYYFLKNSEVYIQFTPYGKTALADLVIYGNYAARGVTTGIPFQNYYSASFEEVYRSTENKIPWKYVLVDTEDYHSVLQMIAVIQEKLPNIIFTQDAMYDENSQLISISTGKAMETPESESSGNKKIYLSSAGFVKWIADGLVEPIAGGSLKRAPLIRETVEIKQNGYFGVLSQNYNLFFSLDWIRNIASAVMSVYSGTTYLFNQSGVDVNISPFASTITDNGVKNIVTFVENSGYSVEVLKSLLYVLSSTEAGTFYLGAIRETDRSVSPEVLVFNECAVFFPYFQKDGKFDCGVFMNGRYLTLDDFCRLYADSSIYLTRVKSSENFFPQ